MWSQLGSGMKLWSKTGAQHRPPEASRLGRGTRVSVRKQSVTSQAYEKGAAVSCVCSQQSQRHGDGLHWPEQSLSKVPTAFTSIAPDKPQPGLERGAWRHGIPSTLRSLQDFEEEGSGQRLSTWAPLFCPLLPKLLCRMEI